MKKKIIILSSSLILVLAVFLFFSSGSDKSEDQIEVKVKKGVFDVVITTSGELQAENSENILGPSGLRNINIYQVKISELIPEGSIVDSGDFVATLDRTEATSKLKDIENEVQKYESQFLKTKLDTTLELRTARDELINLKYAMEEKQIALDQSKYEAPAVIRQADISLEKAQRAHEQAIKNYKLKVQQSNAKMVEVSVGLDNQQRKRDAILTTLDEFEIKAPKPGMLIYAKEWNGAKKKVGSTISAWEPTVATLPDLSTMLSKTFVNEIDIRKLKVGQKVKIGVDAFPEKNILV